MCRYTGLFLCLVAAGAFAKPVEMGTKEELNEARGLVAELAEQTTSVEELLAMVKDTKKGSERYWLYTYAFNADVKDGKYASAVNTLRLFQENVAISDADLVAFVEKNARKSLLEDSELTSYVKEMKARVSAQKAVQRLMPKLRKSPSDEETKLQLAEAQAVCGDWKAALKTLSGTKCDGAAVAKAELENKATVKTATYWWNFKQSRAYSASKEFKKHSAELYKKLLDSGKVSSLDRTLAEKRLAQYAEMEGALPDTADKADSGLKTEMKVAAAPKAGTKASAKSGPKTKKANGPAQVTQMFYIGKTGYDSFQDVIAEAKDGNTILVGVNATFSTGKLGGKSITFDLGGRTLTWESGGYAPGGKITVIDSGASAGRLVLANGNRNYQALIDMSALKAEQVTGAGKFWSGPSTHVAFPVDMPMDACLKYFDNKVSGERMEVLGVTYTYNGSSWER